MGLARKAGKLGIGHDVVFAAVRNGTAKAVILTSDASPRHARNNVAFYIKIFGQLMNFVFYYHSESSS